MAKYTEEERRAIKLAIREHMMMYGPKDWDPVMERYALTRSTFFRLVKEVRSEMDSIAFDEGPGALEVTRKLIRGRTTRDPAEEAKAHLPVAPSPAIVAASPKDALSAFQFFVQFDKIVKDADLLRDSSMVKDENGKVRVKNPALLEKSIRGRLAILETYLNSVEVVYNVERIRELYDIVIDEIGKVSPEVQHAILARLRVVNNRRGLTMPER